MTAGYWAATWDSDGDLRLTRYNHSAMKDADCEWCRAGKCVQRVMLWPRHDVIVRVHGVWAELN